jgi:hypothetical protein
MPTFPGIWEEGIGEYQLKASAGKKLVRTHFNNMPSMVAATMIPLCGRLR